MFAIAFALTVTEAERRHSRGVSQAYSDIATTLETFAFRRIQGSVYVCDSEDMANLFLAINALKALPWLLQRCATSAPSGSSNGRTSLGL
jgi:virulence-associated protein VapD